MYLLIVKRQVVKSKLLRQRVACIAYIIVTAYICSRLCVPVFLCVLLLLIACRPVKCGAVTTAPDSQQRHSIIRRKRQNCCCKISKVYVVVLVTCIRINTNMAAKS